MKELINKKCITCNIGYPVAMFREYTRKGAVYLMSSCRGCEKEYVSERYFKNKATQKKIPNIEGEIWNDVVGYEGSYIISSLARVKSMPKKIRAINANSFRTTVEKLLSININCQTGYKYTSLSKNGKKSNRTIHTMVAESFLVKPVGKLVVNHIDGNKLNNGIENLEWVSQSENMSHLYRVLGFKYPTGPRNKQSKQIIVTKPDGTTEFMIGVSNVARMLGSPYSSVVSAVLTGKRKTYKGHKFTYA